MLLPDSLVERRLCRDGIRRGAYDSVSLHHALRACHIICFEKRYELGTIQTPIRNSTIFSVDTSGRRKAPTKDFLAGLQGNSEFLARKRAVFFRRGGGAKSEAILTNSICLIQKEEGKRGQVPFLGLPLGRSADSSVSFSAILSTHLSDPSGAPRFTELRMDLSMPSSSS